MSKKENNSSKGVQFVQLANNSAQRSDDNRTTVAVVNNADSSAEADDQLFEPSEHRLVQLVR